MFGQGFVFPENWNLCLLFHFPLSRQIQQTINNHQRMGRIARNVKVVTVNFSRLPE